MPFGKFKTYLRKVAARTIPALRRAIREEPPQRAPAAANSPFTQRCEQFLEGGIWLFP